LPHGTQDQVVYHGRLRQQQEYEYTFTVKDCKAPTVVCINGLSVNIMPTGMITLWASDFLQYTEDNCTPTGQIKIGIRKCGALPPSSGFPVDGNGNPITSVTFDCTELNTQCVELWAIDAAGNADHCDTYVIVQDNLGNCGAGGTINVAGAVKTEMTDGVEEAMVNIDGSVNFLPPFSYFDLDQTVCTSIEQRTTCLDIRDAPEKDDNPLNGVTTYDLVLISKHILGHRAIEHTVQDDRSRRQQVGSITTLTL
jgi:hypothetical protein